MSKETDKIIDQVKDLQANAEDMLKELDDIELSEEDEAILDLLDYLDESVSMYHSTLGAKNRLDNAGFQELQLTDEWSLESGAGYYLIVNNSTLIAFVVGKDPKAGFKIVGAHTDSPGFKIKANPLVKKSGYLQLNTEVYGGPLVNTWFDRPLSIAGRVFLKGESLHKPQVKLLNIDEDLLTIPSLAIHMSTKDERSKEPNRQNQLLPIVGMGEDFDLDQLISEWLDVDKDQILSHDLFLYSRQTSSILGNEAEFFQSGKIDNLGMMHAGLSAIISAERSESTQLFVGFDNEEIGSSTQQGAGSAMFRDVLKKISLSLGNDEVTFINQIYKSYMISADQAHAIHPNYLEKADPTNKPELNKGPVIKDSARKSYATDGFGRAVLEDVAKRKDLPLQYFHNRSDMMGGSTIGAIIETNTGIRNIDIGNPMLAMHSINELAGTKDQLYMIKLMTGFFELD